MNETFFEFYRDRVQVTLKLRLWDRLRVMRDVLMGKTMIFKGARILTFKTISDSAQREET